MGKRLLLFVLLLVMLGLFLANTDSRVRHEPQFAPPGQPFRVDQRAHREVVRIAREARDQAHAAAREARDQAREVLVEVHDDLRDAMNEVREEFRDTLTESADELRETAQDIPVPILPGTRVVQAVAQPPARTPVPPTARPPHPAALPHPPAPPAPPAQLRPPGFPGLVGQAPPALAEANPGDGHWLAGLISATEDRARTEARKELEKEVSEWLEPAGVPRSWKPPGRLISEMIQETRVDPVVKDYGTLYVARLRLDVSDRRRQAMVQTYRHQLVRERIVLLAGGLTFVLSCLAALAGYIRADEATRGYYTNPLRLVAAAGVGAAGVLIYQILA